MADDQISPVPPKSEEFEVRPEATLEQVSDEVSISEAEASELIRIQEALAYAREVERRAASLRRRIEAEDEAPPVS
ncbi:MAG: hypothetical protein M3303_06220 [Gemmatimonadota bacterium]|nr:hypothetical protein [Gemmatimonadota bacterium]